MGICCMTRELKPRLYNNLGAWNGVGGSRGRRPRYVDSWLIHVDVWQKPIQYCKAITLQLKTNLIKTWRFPSIIKEIHAYYKKKKHKKENKKWYIILVPKITSINIFSMSPFTVCILTHDWYHRVYKSVPEIHWRFLEQKSNSIRTISGEEDLRNAYLRQ